MTPKIPDTIRFQRHHLLRGFGDQAQLRVRNSTVLVIGAGGLGCPALQYLALSGVGRLIIVDHDVVHLSNLHRQGLYNANDVGKFKAQVAADRCREIDPNIEIIASAEPFSLETRTAFIPLANVVLDCTDQFAVRYLINQTCLEYSKPYVFASVLEYEAQIASFNLEIGEHRTTNLLDWFPRPPEASVSPVCADTGVLGIVTGLAGLYQALEAIKIVSGFAPPLANELLLLNSWSPELTRIKHTRQHSEFPTQSIAEYLNFCRQYNLNPPSLSFRSNVNTMKEVTVQELKALIDSSADFQLIDVREPHEYEICNLGGELIPQAEIPFESEKISKDKKVVIHCRSGARSGNMVQWLEQNKGFNNLYNLKGGILAWAKEIDPSMPTY